MLGRGVFFCPGDVVSAPTSPRFKYPRTLHVPWSRGVTDDDEVHDDVDALFAGQRVVITEKLDGESTSLYADGMHARSPDARPHPSQAWVRNLHGRIAHNIPAGWRVVGENVYARHSIAYEALPSYFFVFSVWNGDNVCLPWGETCEWALLLGLETVPVLYEGWWDASAAHTFDEEHRKRPFEGYVIRDAFAYGYAEHATHSAKYVASRPTTSEHWRYERIVPNGLAAVARVNASR